jgi:uncharacterized protein (DUF1778 family)
MPDVLIDTSAWIDFLRDSDGRAGDIAAELLHGCRGKKEKAQLQANQHKSRSDFILEAACKEAENVLLDQRLFLLDKEQFAQFAGALWQDMAGNRQLETLLSSSAPWEEGGG